MAGEAGGSWLLAAAWLSAPFVSLRAATELRKLFPVAPASDCDKEQCCASGRAKECSCIETTCSSPVDAQQQKSVHILYATTTGTSQSYAEELSLAVKAAGASGDVRCSNVAALEDPEKFLGNLPPGSVLLLVLSTWQARLLPHLPERHCLA